MKRILSILLFIGSFAFGQDYDYQELCIQCAEAGGFYCGDDPSNWTQYAPEGCVVAAWINDNWEDCVDASDENGAVPTLVTDCIPPLPECDTLFVDVIEYIYQTDTLEVPFYIYETIIQLDTIVQTEYITQIIIDTVEIETLVPEYIYISDTVYAEVLDTMFIDVVEEVEIIVFDTIIETEYVEFFISDTVVEYQDVIITEYIDCLTGLPCNSGIEEVIEKSMQSNLIYNIHGQVIRKPEGIYIESGKIKYKL